MRIVSRKGMTLVEVMVALAVAGTALAAGASVLGFLADQHDRPGISSALSAGAVRSQLRDWVSQARVTTEGDAEFRGVAEPSSDRNGMRMRSDTANSEMSFVTFAATDLAPAGTHVHLRVAARGGTTSGLVAELTPFRSSAKPATIVLVPRATGFRVRYLASAFGRPQWQRSWISTSVLPAAVELRLLMDSSTHDQTRSILTIPMIIPLASRP